MTNVTLNKKIVSMPLSCLTGLILLASHQVNADVGNLLWEDNFDELNLETWSVDVGDGCDEGICGWGNAELQWYGESNTYISDVPGETGNKALVLEARSETSNGYAFTSGKVKSSDKIAVQYGMIEVRVQVPDVGIGLWPAAWMLGTSAQAWPSKGEIDMMEMGHSEAGRENAGFYDAEINNYVGSNLIYYSADACNDGNTTCAASEAWETDNAYLAATALTNRFLIYRTYWTETEIYFTVEDNGVEIEMFEQHFTISDVSSEFQAPFYLLLNLAVGGNFTDAATNDEVTATTPAKMYIDYVRVYELDGQGEIFVGNQTVAEVGTFGVFTDETVTDNKLEVGLTSDIYVWNSTTVVDGTLDASEGDNVIAWSYSGTNEWFGGGINPRDTRDMSNFSESGEITFDIKIPADIGFKIGIEDTYTNQNWLEFPANTTTYGLVRDGEWATATIPVADMRGDLVALQSLKGMFYIASLDSDLPTGPFEMAIDNIVWTGGGEVINIDSDGDGVEDTLDNCADTLDGVVVDAMGCPVIVAQSVLIQAEDYTGFSDTTSDNLGGEYRTDAVDIQVTTDTDGGYNVGWTENTETLEYTVDLGAGTYAISTRVAAKNSGAYSLTLDGQTVASDTVATNSWQTFETHNLGNVTVDAGEHTLTITVESAGFNINWINLALMATETPVETPIDTDNDGVLDDVDQCLDSASDAIVDETGCVVVVEKYGISESSETSVEFFVNVSGWADVHYILNGAGQQNFRMTNTGSTNIKTLSDLSAGDVLAYAYTYLDDDGVVQSSEWSSYSVGVDTVIDTDNDGVADNSDSCANTPASASVNSVGCPDTDGDNVFDNIDQCSDTDSGVVVDAFGCEVIVDTDNDGVIDADDQCSDTPSDVVVDAFGCEVIVDTDNDGVIDADDQCSDTPSGVVVDAFGCEVIIDTDNDGVIDANDQCADTVVGTEVDAVGCALITQEFGLIKSSSTSIQFFVDTLNFANLHYTKNDGGQQNLSMNLVNDQRVYTLSDLIDGDIIDYSYTYQPNDSVGAVDTSEVRFTMTSDSEVDSDDDNDTVLNEIDQCDNTPEGSVVNSVGCPDSDADGIFDNADQCLNTLIDQVINSSGCPDSDNDGIFDNIDQCADSPVDEAVNVLGCPILDVSVTALYDGATVLEGIHQEHTSDALITRFGDRPRTRHAKENEFQSYDHYIAHYFEHRSSSIEIIDHVAKGGEGITLNVRTVWPISTQREGRIWYMGWGTKADYIDNSLMEIDTSRGDINGFDGTHFHYTKTVTFNPRKSPSNLSTAGDTALGNFDYDSPAIAIGDLMEFEISQFSGELDGVAITGQTNYYGSTFLYIAGEGIVPWYLENPGEFVQYQAHFQEDTRELPEEYRLGGDTTAPYQYTDEPDNYFMQMALNLDYDKSQKFLEGRRVFHSSFNDGLHDEFDDNGTFSDVTDLIGAHHVNESCSGCHVRNGGSSVEDNGVALDRWIFKVGDASGAVDATRGRVIQPSNTSGSGEGSVSISKWTESEDGLRTPTYTFESGQPATFSARISPRLVGLGLLEAITETDILALEQQQSETDDGISGRANLVTDPKDSTLTRIGRFGWKAGTVSVEHQVAGALNTDMGVKTSVLPNLDCGSEQTDCNSSAAELDDTNLEKLTYYVQTLAVRAQRGLESGVEDQSIKAGKQVFIDTGCVACHTASFQTSEYHPLVELRDQAIQPYTDMLVHDMGDGLADNLAEGTVSGREWRTTPLWGLGLSMCVTNGIVNPTGAEGDDVCNEEPGGTYLHDGRARTIEEAILWHGTNGSEALNSTEIYKALSSTDNTNLHNFLEAL